MSRSSSFGDVRVAVVDQLGNPGGGSRFLKALLIGYRRVRPDVAVTLLCNAAALEREGVLDEYRREGITVVPLSTAPTRPAGASLLRRSAARLARAPGRLLSGFDWFPAAWSGRLDRELRARLHDFDVAHFWWPYYVDPPDTPVPLAATFHDFNFRYTFQTPTFPAAQLRQMDDQTEAWIRRAAPIVSSRFMYDEFVSLYPHAPTRPEVLPLAYTPPVRGTGGARERLQELGVRPPYVLYPANICAHKNICAAVAAHARLAERGLRHQLVLTGPGTAEFAGEACSLGMVRRRAGGNVVGLGYVSNEEIETLLDGAAVVLSTSLYEAGNGPGLEAWTRGVPVAMSDIPSFREHMQVLGVEAATFDPNSPREIADALARLLGDPQGAARMAERSLVALRRADGLAAAGRYLDKLIAVAEARR